jgi:broad specificity phosphatase PhoE
MKETVLYLTRHGETEWNASGRMMGQKDAPLTSLGEQQAAWLRDALVDTPFTTIYASSSPRTCTTAEIIRGQREIPIVASDLLREIFLGDWEGRMIEDLERDDPAELYAYRYVPEQYQALNGGETFLQVQQRLVSSIQDLLARHAGEQILVVSHAIALKSLLLHFEQKPLAMLRESPVVLWTSLSKVVFAEQVATIALYTDTSHYRLPSGVSMRDQRSHAG